MVASELAGGDALMVPPARGAENGPALGAGAMNLKNRLQEKGMAMGIRTFVIAALLVLCAFVSVAPGGAPMGPATAYLGEGQWGVGGEYGYGQADLTAAATVTELYSGSSSVYWHQLFRIDNLTSHMMFGTLAYGDQ